MATARHVSCSYTFTSRAGNSTAHPAPAGATPGPMFVCEHRDRPIMHYASSSHGGTCSRIEIPACAVSVKQRGRGIEITRWDPQLCTWPNGAVTARSGGGTTWSVPHVREMMGSTTQRKKILCLKLKRDPNFWDPVKRWGFVWENIAR